VVVDTAEFVVGSVGVDFMFGVARTRILSCFLNLSKILRRITRVGVLVAEDGVRVVAEDGVSAVDKVALSIVFACIADVAGVDDISAVPDEADTAC
jgi:hypothetical protein